MPIFWPYNKLNYRGNDYLCDKIKIEKIEIRNR